MRYVSIDIETTGLDPKLHDVVEIGAVIDNLNVQAPLEELPTFHCYIRKDVYNMDPYCAWMHQGIMRRLSEWKKHTDKYLFLTEEEVRPTLMKWLRENGFGARKDATGPLTPVKFTAAGKNFAAFDLQFLNNKFDLTGPRANQMKIHHRVIDPAMLYFDPTTDTELPNLQTCMDRAGIEDTVDHTGLDDALQVVKLLRHKYPALPHYQQT